MSRFTDSETEVLKKLFRGFPFAREGVKGALKALLWSDIPKGITEEALRKYGKMTAELIRAKNDRAHAQWWRSLVVKKTLIKMQINKALGLPVHSGVAGGALVATLLCSLLYVASLASPLADASLPHPSVAEGSPQ